MGVDTLLPGEPIKMKAGGWALQSWRSREMQPLPTQRVSPLRRLSSRRAIELRDNLHSHTNGRQWLFYWCCLGFNKAWSRYDGVFPLWWWIEAGFWWEMRRVHWSFWEGVGNFLKVFNLKLTRNSKLKMCIWYQKKRLEKNILITYIEPSSLIQIWLDWALS